MAFFTIADLHLSLGADKPMDIFAGWDGYVDRLERNWRSLVGEDDTVVIPGDISWAMTLEEAREDFTFLHSLPGHKCLLKGNHDYWWATRKKMDAYFHDNGWDTLHIVHNDMYPMGNGQAVCGTRGWFYDAEADEDKKVILREVGRLRASIEAAKKVNLEPVVFLHYPPFYADMVCEEIWTELKQQGIQRCYYGHIHGAGIKKAANGAVDGIRLQLVSCDAVSFMPVLIR